MPPTQTQTEVGPVSTGPDPSIVNLAKAIRYAETSNAADAYTKPGASGEYGAYQFEPATWNNLASKYGVNTPLNQASPQQQNAVAYNYLVDLKSKGYNPAQIASIWNSGSPDPTGKVGTNSSGVAYDTPAYVQKVYGAYQDYKTAGQTATPQPTASPSVDSGQQTYGATFPASPDDNAFIAALKAAGNLPSSVVNFAGGIGSTLMHPIQTAETLGSAAIGGVENLSGQNKGAPDQYQQAANSIGQAFLDRYGSIENARNTAENDPFGFGTDVVSLLAGGAGLAGKGAELADLASGAVRPITSGVEKVVGGTLSRAGAPFAGSVDQTVAGAADRLGVELPATSLSRSPIVQGLENVASKGIGGDTYLARVTKATDDLNAAADSIAAEAGGTEDIAQAGQNIVEGFDKFKQAFFKQNDAVYTALEKQAGDVAAQTSHSLELIDRIIQEKEAIGDTSGLSWFKNKRAVLAGSKGESVFVPEGEKMVKVPAQKYDAPTFSTLKKLRTGIGELQKSKFNSEFVSTNDRQIQSLYGAISQDMGTTLKATGNKELFQLWQKGNADYVKGIQLINSTYGKTIQRLADAGQYDKIIASVIKPSMSALDIQKIFQVVGDQGVKEIRTSILGKVFNDARTENPDGILQFKPQSLATQIKKYNYGDDNKLKDILTPEQYKGLEDMQTVASSLAKAQSLTKGGLINSIRTYGELGAIGYAAIDLMRGDVVGAAKNFALIGMEQGASYFLASDTGQKLLTFGLRNKLATEAVINDLGLKNKVNNANIDNNDNLDTMGGTRSGAGGDGASANEGGTGPVGAGVATDNPDNGDRVVPADQSSLASRAVEATQKNGGITISLKGDVPTSGFSVATSKDTEQVIPEAKWSPEDVAKYINDNYEALSQPNAHFGAWVDNGQVYMDVPSVFGDFNEAMKTAEKADQLAIFDLSKFETHYLKDYVKETTGAYTRKGEEQGAADAGSGGTAASEGGVQDAIKNFSRDTSLKGKGAQLQDASIEHYVRNKDALLADYLKRNGKLVSADEARKLFADVGYNGANSAAFQEVSSQLSKDAMASLLKTGKPGRAVIMAGGSGVGKSTALRALGDSEDVSLIFDGNSSKYESLIDKIKQVKDAGHTPQVTYIYRDPIEAWNNGVITRMLNSTTDKGRVVPLREFLKNHTGSLATVKRAAAEGIPVRIYRNTENGIEQLTEKDLQGIKIPRSLQTRLVRDTEELATRGTITKRQYNALLHDIPHEDYDTLRE